jgi:hypothetical protein
MAKPCRTCKRAAICLGGCVRYFVPKRSTKKWEVWMVVLFPIYHRSNRDVVSIPRTCPFARSLAQWETTPNFVAVPNASSRRPA